MSVSDLLDRVWDATDACREAPVIRLVLRPVAEAWGGHRDRFEALLDGEVVYRGRSPLCGAARVLLGHGVPADVLLTARHEGQGYDAFVARHLGELARLTVTERDRVGLRLEEWRENLRHGVQDARFRDEVESDGREHAERV